MVGVNDGDTTLPPVVTMGAPCWVPPVGHPVVGSAAVRSPGPQRKKVTVPAASAGSVAVSVTGVPTDGFWLLTAVVRLGGGAMASAFMLISPVASKVPPLLLT